MEIIINNLFQEIDNLIIMNTFLSNIKDNNNVEYKIHPTATMIKNSFRNIGDGDILGFDKSYFLKCCKRTIHNIFLVSNKTEYFWNNLIFA